MYTKNDIHKIIIPGGAGYIGTALIESLPDTIEVVIIDNFHIDTRLKRKRIHTLQKTHHITLIEENVSNVSTYKNELEDTDVLIYMASLNSHKEAKNNPVLYETENAIHLQLFLQSAIPYIARLKKIILTSTRGIYGEGPYMCRTCQKRVYPIQNQKLFCPECQQSDLTPLKIQENDIVYPTSYYGVSKKMQEDILQVFGSQHGVLLDIFRIFNVFGPDQGAFYTHIGIIPQMYEQITTTKAMYLNGNGKLTRDFISITDVVDVLTASMFNLNARKQHCETYNLGSGIPVSISDLAETFTSMGYIFHKSYIPEFLDIQYSVADNSKVSMIFHKQIYQNIFDSIRMMYPITDHRRE